MSAADFYLLACSWRLQLDKITLRQKDERGRPPRQNFDVSKNLHCLQLVRKPAPSFWIKHLVNLKSRLLGLQAIAGLHIVFDLNTFDFHAMVVPVQKSNAALKHIRKFRSDSYSLSASFHAAGYAVSYKCPLKVMLNVKYYLEYRTRRAESWAFDVCG